MTSEMVVQLVMSFGIVPGLFVWLLFDTRKEHREQIGNSQERESKLMDHIRKSDDTQHEISLSITKISDTINSMDKTMGYLQKDVEELKGKG